MIQEFTVFEYCKLLNNKTSSLLFNPNKQHNLTTDNPEYEYAQQICSALELKLKETNEKQTHHADYDDYIKINLIKFFYPILLIFGIIGNLISFFVMIRIYKRGKNFHNFALSLAALSMADLGILLFGTSIEYIEDYIGIQIKAHNLFVCKFSFFICYLFSSFSAFLHAFIAGERWLAVASPFKSKLVCTFRANQITIVLLFLLCALFNMPLIWFSSVNDKISFDKTSLIQVKLIKECEIAAADVSFEFQFVLTLIDSLFYCLIPFVVTSAFSCFTLIKLKNIKNKNNRKTNTYKNNNNNVATTTTPNTPIDNSVSTCTVQRVQIRFKKHLNVSNISFRSSGGGGGGSGGGQLENVNAINKNQRRSVIRNSIQLTKSVSKNNTSSNFKNTIMVCFHLFLLKFKEA